MNNTGIIVTARVQSSRLPEKVLQKINGRITFEILLDKLIEGNSEYPVVVAIPKNKDDDILEEIAISKGVLVYRGDDESPMHRLFNAAYNNDFEHVVRVTADDILIDQYLLRKQIEFHVRGRNDYTYMKRCPEGIAAEVIKVDALERALLEVGDEPIEFTSYHMKTRDFNVKEFYPPFEYQYTYRLTMDYEEDLLLLRVIFSLLQEPFSTLDIINLIKGNKHLLQINHMPLVTIYTCNYNTAEYIDECMDSVFHQTFEDFEYLVIDDNSDDNSMDIIGEYVSGLGMKDQGKIKVYRNSENLGLTTSSNIAIEKAKGRYIIRIDSDDILEPNAIEKMLEIIQLGHVQGVIPAFYEFDDTTGDRSEINENREHAGCAMISRWCANEIKYKEDIRYMEGKDFFNRFSERYSVIFHPEPLWYYRRRNGQKSQEENHPEKRDN